MIKCANGFLDVHNGEWTRELQMVKMSMVSGQHEARPQLLHSFRWVIFRNRARAARYLTAYANQLTPTDIKVFCSLRGVLSPFAITLTILFGCGIHTFSADSRLWVRQAPRRVLNNIILSAH
jgi:hypothetical protein